MKDRYDSFPMGKDRGESFVLTVGKKKPHERPESCRMSYAKTTILRWRVLADGCYWREEVFGANVERSAFFSAERMEIKHKAAAEFINDYPRRKFGGRSSNEVHAAFLASA